MNFEVTAVNVLLLVAMAIPGYILIKVKAVKQTAIAPFAKVALRQSTFFDSQFFFESQLSAVTFKKSRNSGRVFVRSSAFAAYSFVPYLQKVV